MSAIAGLFARDGDTEVLNAASRQAFAMSHRGIARTHTAGPVALAAIASQPHTDPLTGCIIVADARIDNRTELPAAGPSDAELILAAYREWGTQCVSRLLGDFAFTIYDPRRALCFCARDPMGVKPFYYYLAPRRFAFGTEIKALLAVPGIPTTIDDEQAVLYLATTSVDRVSTFYQHIKRLPAAHALTVKAYKVELREYWRVDDGRTLRLGSDAEYAAAFSERFRAAVGARLRDASPVGASLSGGLDSSSIVCTASQLGAAPLHTFSLVFPSLEGRALRSIDERGYVAHVVNAGGVQPHYVRGDALSPLGDLDATLSQVNQPFGAPNLYLHQGMSAAARAAGVRVFLDGFDGDTTVSHGVSRLNDLARADEWSAFETEVRAFAAHRDIPAETVLPHFGFPFLAQLARTGHVIRWARAARELARRFGLSRRDVLHRYGLSPVVRRAWQTLAGKSAVAPALLRPTWRRRIADRLRDASQGDDAAAMAGERAAHLQGLALPLYQQVLELADAAAAPYGLEPRYPFFDRKLIEFCVAVPPEQKFGDGWPRLLMRRAMEGVLPPEIQWRGTKSNLAHNFAPRLLAGDRHLLTQSGGLDAIAEYVDVAKARELRDRVLAGSQDDLTLAIRLTILARWLGRSQERQHAA